MMKAKYLVVIVGLAVIFLINIYSKNETDKTRAHEFLTHNERITHQTGIIKRINTRKITKVQTGVDITGKTTPAYTMYDVVISGEKGKANIILRETTTKGNSSFIVESIFPMD